MRRPAVLTVAGAVLAAALLAGCTSSGSNSTTSNAAKGAAPIGAPAQGNNGFDSAGVATKSVTEGTGGGTGGGSGGTGSSGVSASLISDARSVIRTAQMTVGVKDASEVATQADKADALVISLGGDVFGDNRTAGLDASATLTLKVPPPQLDAVLTALSKLGKEQSRSLSSQDVTTEVADVNARVASAAAAIVRLRALYATATKVSDVIEIESELSQREADLESLQAQQRALDSETQLATVTCVLTTMAPPAMPTHHHYSGIGGAFANGWHHFLTAGAWLVTALATVLPFAVLIVLAAAALLWARRRRPAPVPAPLPAE